MHIDAAALDRDHTLSDETLDKMRTRPIWPRYSRRIRWIWLSATAYARVMQEVGAIAPALAVTIGAHQSIGLKGSFSAELQSKKLSIYRSRQGNTSPPSRLPSLEPVAMPGVSQPAPSCQKTGVNTYSTAQKSGSPTVGLPISSRFL